MKNQKQQNGLFNDKISSNGEKEEFSISQDSNIVDKQLNQQQYQIKSIKVNTNKDDKQSMQDYSKYQDKASQINSKIQIIQDNQSHLVNKNQVNEKQVTKSTGQIQNKQENVISIISQGLLKQEQKLQQFQSPYQLALICITWIYFGFSYIMRQVNGEDSEQSNNSSRAKYAGYIISSLLILLGLIGLIIWQFVILKYKIKLESLTCLQRIFLMSGFLSSQILVMEAFVLKNNIADSWVMIGTVIQISYIQSISKNNFHNLIYIGLSTIYLIIRFQFIINWEWQSLIYSILVCTVIALHQENIQVQQQIQTKKIIQTNQKAHQLNNLYYDILGMIPEGVAIFDKNQSTIFCNKTIKDLFECKKHQLNKILLGLSTNQQHNQSLQPSPNHNNHINGSQSNIQSNQQQIFYQSAINQQQKDTSSGYNTNSNQYNQTNKPTVFNFNPDLQILMNGHENMKDDPLLINQQNIIQKNPGSSRLIQFKNETQLKNLNISNLNKSLEESNQYVKQNSQSETDKQNKRIKTLDQQKSIFTPSFKGQDQSQLNNLEYQNNPTFAKIQTKELTSPYQSQGAGIISKSNSKDEDLQSPNNLKYNNTLKYQSYNINISNINVVPPTNDVYSIPRHTQTNLINDNINGQSNFELYSPTHNTSINQQFFNDHGKGILGGGDYTKSIKGIDQSIINNDLIQIDGNSILSNNQLMNNYNQNQTSSKKQQSFTKKVTHTVINASSQRNDEEDESDIDIFNNFLSQKEGKKILKKKLINQKKTNEIIQGETKVSDILTDLFGEIAGQKNSQIYNSAGHNSNLDPSIQSPINNPGYTFVNQNMNNTNKENANTPTSVKKLEFGKSKTFFSQMNKNNNLGYMQYQEDMIKVQVRWKNQIFVLKFLLFEIETSENSSEIFILVLVDPLWQEYYNKRMEEVQKYKMKMFASLSHELRTPLNCTISMLEGLENYIQDPTLIDDYLYPALHSQKLLLNQINDILDFAQIDSGKFKYTFVDFNLEKLLQDCVTLIQMQANVKSLDLQLIYDVRLHQTVKSDPNRIRQILLNFLSNSMKFTPENGAMKIIAEPVFLNETNKIQKYIKLSVIDTGIGMKPETLQNIFNAFNKTEYENEGMNSQGCGLGLAISQSISKGLCSQNSNNPNQFSPLLDFIIPPHLIGIQVESVYQQGNMNPKPLFIPQYSHNNSYSHSMLPLDMINEEEMINSYLSVKNDNQCSNTNQQSIAKTIINSDIVSKQPKEDKDVSQLKDSCCVQNDSIDQDQNNDKQPQFMELGNFFEGQHRPSNDIASQHGGGSPQMKPVYPLSQYSPHHQAKQINNEIQISQNQQNMSTQASYQAYNKLNQNTQNQNNQQFSLTNNSPQKQTKTLGNNKQITVTYDFEESPQLNLQQINEMQKSSSQNQNTQYQNQNTQYYNQNSVLNKNTLLTDNQLKYSTSNSISNFFSSSSNNPSKINMNNQKVVNITRTFTSTSLRQMNSAQGFNGYHSKSNLNDDQGAKLMINLQQYIENSVCVNRCSPILIVDDNQFNILALSKMLQQFFSVVSDKAFDGKQAYEKICARYSPNKAGCKLCTKYEIIFMDIEMPILNGYEVMREVTIFFAENKIEKQDIPYIIACTAHGGDEEQIKAKMSGFDDYISKPIMKNDMQKLLCDWFFYGHYQNQGVKQLQKESSLKGQSSLASDK